MATAQMQPRPYMGPTSESGRMFPQANQLQQGMYYPNPTWSSNPYAPHSAQPNPGTGHSVQHNPYPQHQGQPASTTSQMMTPPRSALPHHQNPPTLSHPQPSPHPGPMITSPNPQSKFEPGIPRTADASSMGRSPTGPPGSNGPNHSTPQSQPRTAMLFNQVNKVRYQGIPVLIRGQFRQLPPWSFAKTIMVFNGLLLSTPKIESRSNIPFGAMSNPSMWTSSVESSKRPIVYTHVHSATRTITPAIAWGMKPSATRSGGHLSN